MDRKKYVMQNENFMPYKTDTEIPAYLPLPRFLVPLDLSNDAKILYALLFDRAGISKENGYIEPDGWEYSCMGRLQDFIFPAYDVRFIAINDDVDSAKGENDFAVFKICQGHQQENPGGG